MSSKSFALCVVLGLTLFGVVIAFQGSRPWSWVLAGLLAVCPLVVAWVVYKSRRVQKDIAAAARSALAERHH